MGWRYRLTVDRALSERERDVLVAIIELASDADSPTRVTPASRRRWLAQVPHAYVVGRCSCGTCPSIDLGVHNSAEAAAGRSRIVLEATTTDAILLLFIDDDHLSYLELAPIDPDLRVREFPSVGHIGFAESDSA